MPNSRVIQITHGALGRLQEIAREEQVDLASQQLRIAVVPGGCSGLTYALGWERVADAADHVAEIGGIKVVVDRRSRLYIEGVELDFSEGLNGKGFHFRNPQAQRTCACGESFGL